MRMFLIILNLACVLNLSAQSYIWTAPFGKFKPEFNPKTRAALAIPVVTNTSGFSVSLPGYWYSSGGQQAGVIGLGYTFQHYVADTLIYALGPYVWYKSPIPTGSTHLPIGYGAAGTYKGLILFGVLTPDFVHWGPVLTLNFSFGNGGITL